MILKAISIDDEPRAHHVIKHYAAKIEQLELVETFTSPLKAASFLKDHAIDILFLDINMPDMDGMSLLKTLKDPPTVIFTTAYDEYAVESYDHEAAGYLLKPIEFPKFYKAVMRAMEQKEQPSSIPPKRGTSSSSLLLKSGTKLIRIDPDDIRFIEASGNYAELKLEGETILVDHTLSELMEQYVSSNFLRIHRSYSINIDYLQEFESHRVKVANNNLPIGKTYRKEVRATLVKS